MSIRRWLTTKVERSLFGTMFAVVSVGLAFVPLVIGLLLGVALAAPSTSTTGSAVAASAPAPSATVGSESHAPGPGPTHVDELVNEIQSLKALSKWQLVVFGTGTVAVSILLLLLLIKYARVADKMKIGFGFLEFEVKDAAREAAERAEDAEASVGTSARTLNRIYVMLHSLQVLGASGAAAAFNQFLKQCAEEAAAHVDVAGTVRASIWLKDGDALRIAAGYRVTSATITNFRFSAAKRGFAWDVFTSGKSAIKNTKDEPDEFAKDPDSRYSTTWILGVPIWEDEAKKTPAGVLCVAHDDDEPLTKTDTTISSFYADLAAIAVRLSALRGVALMEQGG